MSFQTLGSNLLVEEFVADSSLLDILFYYLETVNRNHVPSPPDAYFAKLVGSLFDEYPDEVRHTLTLRWKILIGYFIDYFLL